MVIAGFVSSSGVPGISQFFQDVYIWWNLAMSRSFLRGFSRFEKKNLNLYNARLQTTNITHWHTPVNHPPQDSRKTSQQLAETEFSWPTAKLHLSRLQYLSAKRLVLKAATAHPNQVHLVHLGNWSRDFFLKGWFSGSICIILTIYIIYRYTRFSNLGPKLAWMTRF